MSAGAGISREDKMNRKRILLGAGALLAVTAILWLVLHSRASAEPTYRFGTVEPGAIQQTVSATGALSAVRTVQVGTQVSGQVAEIHADFNDRVTKGQLLARIDPTLQQQAVRDAQAQLEKAQAQYLQAKQEYDRNQPLYSQKFISASEFGTVRVNLSVAQATVKSAQEQLAAADAQQTAAGQALEVAQARYRAGLATFVEVTLARATLVQAQSAVVSSRSSLVFQQALMSYYTGVLDPTNVRLGG
jgi:multidrug efflux pump subunit AcrA (membrane-fusion protein)